MPQPFGAASADLGLGGVLGDQVTDETEEQKRRKRLGLSPLAQGSRAASDLFGLGAKPPLGMSGGRGI